MKYVEWQWRILREKCGITEAIARFKVLCWRLPGRKPSVTRARVLAQIRTRQEVKPLRTPLLYIIEVPLFLTSALDGDEWLASRLGRFTQGKEHTALGNRWLGCIVWQTNMSTLSVATIPLCLQVIHDHALSWSDTVRKTTNAYQRLRVSHSTL